MYSHGAQIEALVFLISSSFDNEDLDVNIHTTGNNKKFDMTKLLYIDNRLA